MTDLVAEPFNPEASMDGFGPYHVNWFRVCLALEGAAALATMQQELLGRISRYINKNTARVVEDAAHVWQGNPTFISTASR